MIVIYVDKYGNAMKMESPDEPISLPVLCKEYTSFQHSLVVTINPGLPEYRQMMKVERKQKPGFSFTWMKVNLVGDPRDQFSWVLEGDCPFEGETLDMFRSQWISRREAWHKQYCSYWGLTSTQYMSTLGDTFYLADTAVSDLKNCSIHLFGSCKIWTQSLSNVLLFIHGDYEET